MAELQVLLATAAAAPPANRIRYRDQIANYGLEAISAMSSWLDDPRLAAFAVRVIIAAGSEFRPQAVAALTNHRSTSTGVIQGDIDFGLEQLGAKPKPIGAPRPNSTHVIPPSAGEDWPGFRTEEFGQIAGTSWRSREGRTSLAPIITRALRYQHPHFQSYPIERSPEVHFALRERYQQGDEHAQGWRAAKLVIYAHAVGETEPLTRQVVAGLYVEKSDGQAEFGPLDGRWDWTLLVTALGSEHIRDELARVMVRHDLQLGDYRGGRHGYVESVVGFIGRFEEGDLVLKDATGLELGRGWEALQGRLRQLPADRWHDFLIWRTWPAVDAIAAGRSFATDEQIPVLSDLALVYLDVVRPVLPHIASTG